MALNSRHPVDPRWIQHNMSPASALHFAEIEIFNPAASEATYNATTNAWTSAREIVWTGKARLQPVRSASNRANTLNPTSIREIEVFIAMTGNTLEGHVGEMPEIRTGYQIFVTDSPFDETLKNFVLNVRSSMNSSNPWEKMLYCESDQEVKHVATT